MSTVGDRSGGSLGGESELPPVEELPTYVQPLEPERVPRLRWAGLYRSAVVVPVEAVVLGAAALVAVAAALARHPELRPDGVRAVVGASALGGLAAMLVGCGLYVRRPPPPFCPVPLLWRTAGLQAILCSRGIVGRALVAAAPLVVITLLVSGDTPEFCLMVGGVVLGACLTAPGRWWWLVREDRRTSSWRLRLISGWSSRVTRTYVGDDLVVPGLGWRVTLPAPLDGYDLRTAPPAARWAVSMATGRFTDALALAQAQYRPADPCWSGWAALALVQLGRLDEAERWVQRAVDDGYRGPIDPEVARALAVLHATSAWHALSAQARRRPRRDPVHR